MRRRGASLQVKVDGHWLTELASWGDLEHILAWPGDCLEATWSMTTQYASHHPAFHRDAPVTISRGGHLLWGGLLQEPEWNGREAHVTARGLYRVGENYPALDSSGDATLNPTTAITAQMARGLAWRKIDVSIPNSDFIGDAGDVSVAGLLDQSAASFGTRWGVTAGGVVYMAYDSPTGGPGTTGVHYHAYPGTADLSPSDEGYASHVMLRYTNLLAQNKTAVYPPVADPPNVYERRWGHNDWRRDITDLGPIADATADALAQTIYERGKKRPAWTQGLDLMEGELITAGGVAADLDAVRPNRVLRVHGVRDEVAHTNHVDVVTGKLTRNAGSRTLHIDPLGVVVDTLDDVYQQMFEQAWRNNTATWAA